jgi:hypothetical protein
MVTSRTGIGLLLAAVSATALQAGLFERHWQWFLGSTGRSAGLAAADGCMVSGETWVETDRYGVVIARANSDGDTVWVRHMLDMDAGGGFACRLTDRGYAVLAESAGSILARKFSATGDPTWTYRSTWGGPISGIVATADGGCLAYGRIPLMEYDMGAIKLAADGREEWTRWYDEPRMFDSWARGACEAASGGFILCGVASDYTSVNLRLIRINPAGDTSWTRLYHGPIAPSLDAVAETGDKGVIAAGKAYDTLAARDGIYLLRTDSAGAELWTRYLTLPGAATRAAAIRPTADGGFIIAGTVDWYDSSRVLLVKLNSACDTVWTRILGGEGNEVGADVQQADDGGFVVAGTSDNGAKRILLVRTDALGRIAVEEPAPGTPLLARITISPNPATSASAVLSFTGPLDPSTPRPLILSLSDVSGRTVRKSSIANRQSQIVLDLRGMRAGVYMVTISSGSFSATQKLIVQR